MLGHECTENPPTLSSSCGDGNIQQIAGLQTYVTGDLQSNLAVLLIADAFGNSIFSTKLNRDLHYAFWINCNW